MSQTDINILLRATDQASSVIDSAASKLSGNMAKIEDANKKVTQASDKVGVSSRTVALAFNNVATSGMALYNAYDRVRDMQVQLDRANLMVQSTLNSLNDAQRRYANVVAESGSESEKAKAAAADLSLAQERYRVACERAEMTQNNLNQTMVQSALTVVPSLITMISSVATITKSWTSATEMASSALTYLQAHPIILVITAVVELVAVLAIAYQRCEAFRNGVNALSTGALSLFTPRVKEAEAAVEGLTWAQTQWLQSFEDLKKVAPSTANAINGFADACYEARHATDNLGESIKTVTAEYANAKKAIDDQIRSLEILTVTQIGRDREGRNESATNIWIAETISRLRGEMDGLDQSYANVTDEIKKKIKAQEDEKRTQEILTSLTDTYNLSVAKASLVMNTYGQDFSAAFGAGRINDALDVAKNFAAEFSISINDAIRTLESFSTETEDSFSHLSDAAKEYLTGQAQETVAKFKDCAGGKLEALKKKVEDLDILEALKIAAGNFTAIMSPLESSLANVQAMKRLLYVPTMAEGGVVTRPTLAMVGEAGPEAIVPLKNISGFNQLQAVEERLRIYLEKGTPLMAEGGIVAKPTLTWVGERGPEAVIPLDKTSTIDQLKTLEGRLEKNLERGTRHMGEGGIVTSPTLTWIGDRGPEAVIPLDRASGLGNVTIQINVTGALDNQTVDYAVSKIKGLLENVSVENSSVSGSSTHKRIRWED